MKIGMFFAIAATALLGVSCSVQDFSTKVMDKPCVSACISDAPKGALNPNGNTRSVSSGGMTYDEALGDYSFSFGLNGFNLFDFSSAVFSSDVTATAKGITFSNNYTTTLVGDLSDVFPLLQVGHTYVFSCDYSNVAYERFYLAGSRSYWSWGTPYTITQSDLDVGSFYAYGNQNQRVTIENMMLVEGSISMAYQPFAYGFSFSTPFSASRSFSIRYGNNAPADNLSYSVVEDGVTLLDVTYGYSGVYFDLHFVDHENAVKFEEYFDDHRVASRTHLVSFNTSYIAGGDTGTIFHFGFDVAFSSGSILDDFTYLLTLPNKEGYDLGYTDGQESLDGGIFLGARDVVLTYRKNGGANGRVVYNSAGSAYEAFKRYMFNGLLAVNEWLYNDRGALILPDWDGSSDVSMAIDYINPVSIVASPLYIDVDVSVDNPSASYCTNFTPMLTDSTTPLSLTFDRTFKGLVTDYYSYDLRYTVFGRYYFTFPAQPVQCLTNYVGIVSSYAAGYINGVNSRNAEISDLSQTIIDLQSDLSQFNGMSYDQIYELGRQAGINSGNAATTVMSGLFGAVLSVPLSIFGGLSEFSVLGVSVLSLIISLLVVAVAVMVLKRFL